MCDVRSVRILVYHRGRHPVLNDKLSFSYERNLEKRPPFMERSPVRKREITVRKVCTLQPYRRKEHVQENVFLEYRIVLKNIKKHTLLRQL